MSYNEEHLRNPEAMMHAVGRLSDPGAPVYPYGEAPGEMYRELDTAPAPSPAHYEEDRAYELRDQVLEGDHAALQALVERFADHVLTRSNNTLERHPDAGFDLEDIVQEHWVALFETLPGLRTNSKYPLLQHAGNVTRRYVDTALADSLHNASVRHATFERLHDIRVENDRRAADYREPLTPTEIADYLSVAPDLAQQTYQAWCLTAGSLPLSALPDRPEKDSDMTYDAMISDYDSGRGENSHANDVELSLDVLKSLRRMITDGLTHEFHNTRQQ